MEVKYVFNLHSDHILMNKFNSFYFTNKRVHNVFCVYVCELASASAAA